MPAEGKPTELVQGTLHMLILKTYVPWPSKLRTASSSDAYVSNTVRSLVMSSTRKLRGWRLQSVSRPSCFDKRMKRLTSMPSPALST